MDTPVLADQEVFIYISFIRSLDSLKVQTETMDDRDRWWESQKTSLLSVRLDDGDDGTQRSYRIWIFLNKSIWDPNRYYHIVLEWLDE